MIRSHFDGIVNWTRSRQTRGYIEAINGLFQAAKQKARGYTRFILDADPGPATSASESSFASLLTDSALANMGGTQ